MFLFFLVFVYLYIGAGKLGQKDLRYLLPAVYFLKARGMEGFVIQCFRRGGKK